MTPAASCPSQLDASHPARCVCVCVCVCPPRVPAGYAELATAISLALSWPFSSQKPRPKVDLSLTLTPAPPRPGHTWQTGCSLPSPSTLSQDIPAHEEHARRANPSGNAGIRHRGAWVIQEREPDRGSELDRSSPGWPARLGLQ